METIYEIDGEDLRWLAEALTHAAAENTTVRVTIQNGLQIKARGAWYPPLGRLDPTCITGQVRAAVERAQVRAARNHDPVTTVARPRPHCRRCEQSLSMLDGAVWASQESGADCPGEGVKK